MEFGEQISSGIARKNFCKSTRVITRFRWITVELHDFSMISLQRENDFQTEDWFSLEKVGKRYL